jgi:ATP-dependent DNA ligase
MEEAHAMTWRFKRDLIPQKARGKLDEAMWDDLMYVAEVKEDGDRRISQFCASGLVRFTGTPSKKHGDPVEKTANIPHLSHADFGPLESRRRVLGLEGTVLDGEIVAPWAATLPGGKSKYVTSIMGSLPDEAVRKQKEHGWLHYVVFDCLFYRGMDLRGHTLSERQNVLDQVLKAWGNTYAQRVQRAAGVGKRRFYEATVASGGEGVVLKHVRHLYGDQKRWIKVKYEATADVVLIGYKTAKALSQKVDGSVSMTKYAAAGLVGSMIFGQTRDGRMWECGSCSGFDDALRLKVSRKPKEYLGRVVKIKHYGREPTGAFRHPQFLDWRTDKSPAACIYDPEET